MRKTHEELQKIKSKYSVDRLESWSKYNTYKTSKYEYFLKYVAKIKEDRNDSAYAPFGGLAHNVLEKFYLKEIQYDDMIDLFNDGWFTFHLSDLKFDRTNEEKNNSISEKYKFNMQHFFKHHKFINRNVDIERFLIIKIGNYIFQGYADMIYKDDDDNFIIQDHKTSSIYKGKKIDKEKGQLVLYAEGLHQLGVPLEKIKICWNFLKYCKVTITQAKGDTTERDIERIAIGESLKSNAKMWLKKLGYSIDEINSYLDLLVQTNSVECLPQEIQEKYKFDDCYVYISLNQNVINELKTDIINTLHEIIIKENEYFKTLYEKLFWDEDVEKESYYFANLCGYSSKLHKPYGEWVEVQKQKRDNKDNIFSSVGGDNIIKEDDLSWLDSI